LLTPLPAPPVMSPAAVSALLPAAAQSPVPQARPPFGSPQGLGEVALHPDSSSLHQVSGSNDAPDMLRPNAAGVIDLAGALNAAQNQADQVRPANPFRLRYHPPILSHTVQVAVEAVMLGATDDQACCVLNRQAFHSGDTFEGLSVEQITHDAILLRSARYRLTLPVDDRPVTLQLPTS
jgi:hypothetical protein